MLHGDGHRVTFIRQCDQDNIEMKHTHMSVFLLTMGTGFLLLPLLSFSTDGAIAHPSLSVILGGKGCPKT